MVTLIFILCFIWNDQKGNNMDEEIKEGIKAGKAILDGRRTDNIEEQRQICKELLKYRKQCCNGKTLTISEQLIMHDVEIRGFMDRVIRLENKFKKYEIESIITLFINLIIMVFVIMKFIYG